MFVGLWLIAIKFIYSLYETYWSIFTKNDVFFMREILIKSGKGSPISTNQVPRNCKQPRGFQEQNINKFHKYALSFMFAKLLKALAV